MRPQLDRQGAALRSVEADGDARSRADHRRLSVTDCRRALKCSVGLHDALERTPRNEEGKGAPRRELFEPSDDERLSLTRRKTAALVLEALLAIY